MDSQSLSSESLGRYCLMGLRASVLVGGRRSQWSLALDTLIFVSTRGVSAAYSKVSPYPVLPLGGDHVTPAAFGRNFLPSGNG